MSWTPDTIETLRILWKEGLSASQIAARLGPYVTRNAVIGKATRLKLNAGAGARRVVYRPRAPKEPKEKGRPGVRTVARPTVPTLVKPLPLLRPRPTEPPQEGPAVGIADLTGCKWPVNDGGPFLYCNAKRWDDRYCEYHKHLGVQPIAVKK